MKKILKSLILLFLLFFMAGCEFLPSGNNGKNYRKSFELAEEVGYTGSYDDWRKLMNEYRDKDVVNVLIEDCNIIVIFSNGESINVGVDEDWIDISGGHEKPDEPEKPNDPSTNPELPSNPNQPGDEPEIEIYYTIIFDTGCDYDIDDLKVKKGDIIVEPVEPEREGYIFDGWYYNDIYWNFSDYVVTEDMELVAKWKSNEVIVEFTYNIDYGFCSVNTMKGRADDEISLPSVRANQGYQFVGWQDSATGEIYNDFLTLGNENLTLVAAFTFEVTLVCDIVETKNYVGINENYTLPRGTTANGRGCIGWYDFDEDHLYHIGDTLDNKPIRLAAIYRYDLYFHDLNGSIIYKTMDETSFGLFGNKIQEPVSEPENFIAWCHNIDLDPLFIDEVETYPYSFDGRTIHLYRFGIEDHSYTISFDTNGGNEMAPIEVKNEFDVFVSDILSLFNKASKDDKVVTANNFNISAIDLFDDVFCEEETLKKFNWLFTYIYADINQNINYNSLSLINQIYYDHTKNALEVLMNELYLSENININGISAICEYIHRLLNKCDDTDIISDFNFITTDYSVRNNVYKFIYKMQSIEEQYPYSALPVPTKPGYVFTGWYDINGNLVEEVFGDITLIAGWKDEKLDVSVGEARGANIFVSKYAELFNFGDVVITSNGNSLTVGTELFSSLDEAIENANDQSIIYIDSGDYNLTNNINKNITLIGPNADLKYSDFGAQEAIVYVNNLYEATHTCTLNSENFEFNGIHFVGLGGGAGNSGRMFADGPNIQNLVFKSCIFSDANTVFKFVDATTSYNVHIEDCHIYNIGQFFLWVTSGMNKVDIIGCYIDGSSCGAIENQNAALFRIRHGFFNVENTIFNGDPTCIVGYFESTNNLSTSHYNTFINVTKYFDVNKENLISFDRNLYLDFYDNVIPSPNNDVFIYNNKEELAKGYELYLSNEIETYTVYLNYLDAKGKIKHVWDAREAFLTDFYNWCLAQNAFTAEEMTKDAFIGVTDNQLTFDGLWINYSGGAGNPSDLFPGFNYDYMNNFFMAPKGEDGTQREFKVIKNSTYFLNNVNMNAKWGPYMAHIAKICGGITRVWGPDATDYFIYELARTLLADDKTFENVYGTANLENRNHLIIEGCDHLLLSIYTEPVEFKSFSLSFENELPEAFKEGYVFVGWSNGEKLYTSITTEELNGQELIPVFVDDIVEGGIYIDFVSGFSTYAESWRSVYTSHEVNNTDLGISNRFLIEFSRVNKPVKGTSIDDRPVISAKSGEVQYVTLTLIDDIAKKVEFDLKQWTTKTFDAIYVEYFDGTSWVKCSSKITVPEKIAGICVDGSSMFRLVYTSSYNTNTQIGFSGIQLFLK